MATKSISDLNYECPVCIEKILPPVYQCINGHILCENCQKKVSHCPVCREPFWTKGKIRCLEVERIIQMQEHPCPHVHKGCNSRLTWDEVRDHELDCGFASQNFCDLMGIRNCSASVSKQKLLSHFALSHNNDVRSIVWDGYLDAPYSVTILLPKSNSMATEYVAINVHEEYCPVIFILAIRFGGGRVSWTPYVVGSKKTASFYSCKIQMGRTVEPLMWNVSWSGPVFSIGNNREEESGMSLNLPETNVRKMSTVCEDGCNSCFQINLSFHRNMRAHATESSSVLQAD